MDFFNKLAEQFIRMNRRLKKWQRAVSALAAVVVFATTYALVLPAITLDKETASTQAGIEIAASENDSESDGTVYEAEPEEEPAEEPQDDSEEPQEADPVTEDSGSENGSREAEEDSIDEDSESDNGKGTEEQTGNEDLPDAEDVGSDTNEDDASTAETLPEDEADEETKLITEDTQLTYEYIDEAYEDGIDDENDDGINDGYIVYAEFGADAKLPKGVELQAEEITKESDPELYEAYYEKALSGLQDKYDENTALSFARFYDIKFVYNGEEVEPSGDVKVRIEYKKAVEIEKETTVDAVHFDKNNDEEPEVIDSEVEAEKKGKDDTVKTVEFESAQFSVYGIIGSYTVDFLYAVNGKMYEFSLPGGGFVSFTDLVEVLGITSETKDGESKGENGIETAEIAAENEVAPLTLNDVVISDATRKFVADVAGMEFSTPEFVDVSKVEADTTVGEIKQVRGLEVQYSAELTQEQIDGINNNIVEAGDWALISMQPFASEETLTVTMKTGEVFIINVTDDQAGDPLGLNGESFVITNSAHNRSLKAQADSNAGSLQAQNPPSSDAINIWKFEYDEEAFNGAGGYYLVCVVNDTNRYLRVDGNSLELASVKPSEAQDGQEAATPFKVSFDHDQMRYRISGAADGNSSYLTYVASGYYGNGRFSLTNTKSDNNLLALRDTVQPSSTPGTIGTWDIKGDGIVMKLFDYEGTVKRIGYDYWGSPYEYYQDIDEVWGADVTNNQDYRDGQGINRDRSLLFTGSGLSNNEPFNNFTGDKTGGNYYSGYAFQDIVNYNLGADGFPVLQSGNIKTDTDSASGGSLAYLFNDSDISNAKTAYTGEDNSGLSGLLRKDRDGYYYYDSEENFAKLVGDEVILYSDTYGKNTSSSTDVKTTKIGLFPFDDYQSNQGEEKGPSGSVYNHQFGMTIATDFVYPENGIVPETGEPMVFEFSGDDDVWVFVDGVLVLDLGGVHQPISGKIDFNTGNVTITEFGSDGREYTSSKSTTIDAMFAKASQEAGKTITFDKSEYSAHKFEFFYLERGGCDSNCKIKFNLLTTKSVTLEKKLEGLSEEELAKYSDQSFTFEFCKKNSSIDEDFELYNTADTEETDTERNHTIRRNAAGEVIDTGFPIKNGQISLKPGESVTVFMLPTTAVFHAAEVDQANMAAYDPPTGERYYQDEKIENIALPASYSHFDTTIRDWQTSDYAVSDTDKIVIINKPLHTNLTVNKIWTDGNDKHSGDTVQFTVQATVPGDGADAAPVPYAVSDIDGKVFDLNAENNWLYTFANLPAASPDGKPITYTVTEIPIEGYLTEVTSTGSAYTITNTPLAALQLKKQVTINDFDPTHSSVTDKTVADGTYIVDIAGTEGTETEGQSYTVKITVTNGAAVSATVRDNTAAEPVDTPVPLTNGVLEIPKMLPGVYTVTEAPDSKTVLTAINSTAEGANTDLENRRITITLDGTDTSVQLVTLINNYAGNSETDIAHISVRKTFAGLKPGMKLPEGFNVKAKVTAVIDGQQKVFNYTLTGRTDTVNGITWNQSVNDDGDIVWNWKIAIKGLNPDAQVEVQELNYTKPGYDVTTSVNPQNTGGDGTSYTGTVSVDTTVDSIAEVITEQNTLVFPLEDKGTEQTIFIARIVPSQTSLVISKSKLNLSERAALEEMLRDMPNAEDWYNNTPPMYYSFEEAANDQIVVRNQSTVTYYEEGGKGYIRFSKKAQWNMVASRKIIYVEGRPADFNFVNSYAERGVGIDIVKVDNEQRTQKLPGAVFTLTKLDESTTPGHIVYKKVPGTDTLEKQEVSDPTSNSGETSFAKNLTSGFYEIKETKLPDGYVLEGDGCIYVKIEDGVAWYLAVSEDEETPITEWTKIPQTSEDDLIQVTHGRADDPATDTDETVNTLFSIGNIPGATLPNAGGPGTKIFTIFGTFLIAGAGLLLWRRRRPV